nr:transposase [Streptomyces mirabilis]
MHQAYRDGVEDQLGSLSLVLSTIALWTTRYVDDAVAQLGRYSFTASTPAAGALRPLSDADALELDEDDEGAD